MNFSDRSVSSRALGQAQIAEDREKNKRHRAECDRQLAQAQKHFDKLKQDKERAVQEAMFLFDNGNISVFTELFTIFVQMILMKMHFHF